MAAIVTPSCKKRLRGSPTGNTPQQKSKQPVRCKFKGSQLSKRRLTYYGDDRKKTSSRFTVLDTWSLAEERALIQFLLLHSDRTSWISTKKIKFWESASEFVHSICGVKRTSKCMRCGVGVSQTRWRQHVSCCIFCGGGCTLFNAPLQVTQLVTINLYPNRAPFSDHI